MFSGIIRHTGEIARVDLAHGLLAISAPRLRKSLLPGDSIAIDGVCLTVTHLDKNGFSVDVTPETIRKTAFRWKSAGDVVNLELSMRLSDRIHGHIVLGHVDGVGVVNLAGYKNSKINLKGPSKRLEGWYLYLSIPQQLKKYFVKKGSWAVNGVSLTISDVRGKLIGSAIIPETLKRTNLKSLREGDRVNVEVDVLARYALGRRGTRVER